MESTFWRWKFRDWPCETHVSCAGSNEETLWIALHGFTGSGEDFDPLVNQLPQGSSFEAPDLPGHGLSTQSPPIDCISMDACDAMLLERIQGLKHRRVVLMGYSMGGRVALHFASRFSHLLDALVLIGANPGIQDEVQREQRLHWEHTLCTRLADDGVAGFMAYWQQLEIIRSQQSLPPELLQAMQTRRAQASAEGLIQNIRGMGTGSMSPLWRALPTIKCPLLFCAGEEDHKYRSIGEQVVSCVQNGKLAVIGSKAGHAAHLEGLELFGDILRAWFQESVLSI